MSLAQTNEDAFKSMTDEINQKMDLHRIMKKDVAAQLGRHNNTISFWIRNMNQERYETITKAIDQILQNRYLEQLKREQGLENISNIEFLERIRKNSAIQ